MLVHLVDYDAGNIHSVRNALRALNIDVVWARSGEELRDASCVLVPGVGAFPSAMQALRERQLDTALRDHVARGGGFVGVCLGFQILFESSDELGVNSGLGIVPGRVTRFSDDLTVPHMGWNEVSFSQDFKSQNGSILDREDYYFVHSYRPVEVAEEWVAATTEYGGRFVCAVARGAVAGFQFHPEKSGAAGLRLLRATLSSVDAATRASNG